MRYQQPDQDFFVSNRAKFTSMLPAGSVAIFHSNDLFPRNGDQYFPFRQQSDFFYLSGIDQEESVLMLAPGHPNPSLREVLFVKETSEQIAIWEGQKLTKAQASEHSGIKWVQWTKDQDVVLKELMSWAGQVYLNANEYPKNFNAVPYRDMRFAKELREQYPLHRFERSAPLLSSMRKIKTSTEIELIAKAGEISGLAFERVLAFLGQHSRTRSGLEGKRNIMEYEVQAEIEYAFTKNGANGNAYQPIVASGANACVLHYIDNDKSCNEGELLLMDFGAEYANYAADITRTIPVSGRFTPRQKDCYEAVLRVHDEAIKLLVPGTTIDAFNKEVNMLMEEEMIGLGLFSRSDVEKQDPHKPLFMKYFMHGTSHPIGLDVHDTGSKYDPLEPGMVLTCEPGLYIREENTGIRIENNILVTSEGPVNLTEHIPVKVEEIEVLMNAE